MRAGLSRIIDERTLNADDVIQFQKNKKLILEQEGMTNGILFDSHFTGRQAQPDRILIQRFQNMPKEQRLQVHRILKESARIAQTSTVDEGIVQMKRELMPLFFGECAAAKTETRRTEINEMKKNIHAFAFMFLTQSEADREDTLSYIEVKQMNNLNKELFKRLKEDSYLCC